MGTSDHSPLMRPETVEVVLSALKGELDGMLHENSATGIYGSNTELARPFAYLSSNHQRDAQFDPGEGANVLGIGIRHTFSLLRRATSAS